MVYVFLAEGFEEVEALTPVDVLKRTGIEVKTVGVTSKTVISSHGLIVTTDITQAQLDVKDLNMIILPGGMPGTLNLEKSDIVKSTIDYCMNNKIGVAAICAAPSVLGHMGYLRNKDATCFPGFEKDLIGANVKNAAVCVDDNVITARGAGVALEFSFAIVEYMTSSEIANKIKSEMQCR